jgi:CheY-like chemotaxis protein
MDKIWDDSQVLAPVLVVEDNGLNQKVAILLLERLGMKAEIANNGLEAIEAINHRQFSVILMDCHMPEMDGFEATAAIRAIQASRGYYTPIIAVTALTADHDRQRCLEAGMDDYLPKPIEKDLLKNKIDLWLQNALSHAASKIADPRKGAVRPAPHLATDPDMLNFAELEEFYGKAQLSELLQNFTRETRENIALIEVLLKDADAVALRDAAGNSKAACTALGARQLARLFQYLQEAAVKADWIEASQTLLSIQRAFAQNKNQFQCGIITEQNPPFPRSDVDNNRHPNLDQNRSDAGPFANKNSQFGLF